MILHQKVYLFVQRYEYHCLAFTVLCIWSFIYREYFLFDRLFLFEKNAGDTFYQFYPIEYFKISAIKENIFSSWSFQFDLGANIYKEFINTSPFEFIYLFFNNYNYIESIPLVIFLKFLFSALLFYAFLKKINLSLSISFLGAILYSFSGYMILNSHWYHYLDYALFLSLFLYFFEVWYKNSYWFPLVILIGLITLKREIQLLQIVFFGSFYVAYRYVNDYGWNKKIFNLYFRLGCIFILGLFVGSFFYFPDIHSFLSSSRVQSSTDILSLNKGIFYLINFDYFLNILLRTLSPDMLYSWLLYHGHLNYFEDSTFYIGIFSFIVCTYALLYRNKNLKLLWIYPFIIILLILFPFFIRVLNVLVSGSLKYISLYFSIFILLPFLIIIHTIQSQKELHRLFIFSLFFSAALTAIVVYIFLYKVNYYPKINSDFLYLTFTFLFIYVFCIYSWSRNFIYFKYILFIILIFEVVLFSRLTVSSTPAALHPFFYYRGEYYFNTETKNALQFLLDTDKSFYRIEKGYRDVYLNDALVQGNFGTEAYLGFTPAGIRDFFYNFHLSENSPNLNSYRYGLEKKGPLQSLLGVKYFLCRNDEECSGLNGFSLMHASHGMRIYKNDSVHAFGRMFYRQISPQNFQNLAPADKLSLVPHTVITNDPVPGVALYSGANPTTTHQSVPDFTLHSWNQHRFSGTITLDQPGILFFPIPFDQGWQVMVNGKRESLLQLDFGFSGVWLSSAGKQDLTLCYRPPFMLSGLAVSGISLIAVLYLRRRYPIFPAV